MRAIWLGALAALLTACASGGGADTAPRGEVSASAPYIVAAVADPRRPEADTSRDALRHPADMLAFMQVRPGQRVADIGPGGGYFTRILAVAVGEQGRVLAVDRAPGTPERPSRIAPVASAYPNVTVVTTGYAAWTAPEPLDAIMIVQIFHDFHLPQMNLDVPAATRAMFNALKPGGVLLVVDHAANAGAADAPGTLHRIDPAQARREFEAAGFVFEAESEVLRNPADNHSERVFEGDIRGHTDQFVMRFRKPA